MQTQLPATVMEVTHTGIKTKFDLWAVRDQPAFENKPVAPVGFYKNAVSLQYNIPPPPILYHHFSAHVAWCLLTLTDTPVHFMILRYTSCVPV